MDQYHNKNLVIYTDQYGNPIQRQTLRNNPPKPQKYSIPTNQKMQNEIPMKYPNNYNIQNTHIETTKGYNTGPIKHNQINNEIYLNEINSETYIIDQNTGKKIILQTKNTPKANTQFKNKINKIPVNETYYVDPQTGKNIQLKNTAYQAQLQNQQYDLTQSAYHDLVSSIDPNMINGQIKKTYIESPSPIIENFNEDPNSQAHKDQMNLNRSATLMSVSTLARIPYNEYPEVKFSDKPFFNIAGYGLNSYNGKVKKFNEDRIKAIADYKIKKNSPCNINISYFGIFDGHSGNKCSDFLKEHLDEYLFNSPYFPTNLFKAISESFRKAEENFKAMVYDPKSNLLLDKSGSCALVMLILNNYLYAINLGDSRALYSYDSGKYIYQITRDHKPNDEIEKRRIEKVGGKIFYANKITRNGREIELKEEDFGKNFTFPYRILPGKIAVNIYYFIILFNKYIGCKNYWRLLCKNEIFGRVRRNCSL